MDWLDRFITVSHKIQTSLPWIGYLLVSVVGGIAAYMKEWELRSPQLSCSERFWMLFRKLFFAIFASIIWYQLVISQNMTGSPFSYIGASLVGLYATEFLDFMWNALKTRIGGSGTKHKGDGQ